MKPIPQIYLGQAQDWHRRFVAFADSHLAAKEQAEVVVWPSPFTFVAGGFGVDGIAKSLDAMFTNNLATLGRIESRL